ncbi:MAG TPA: hypothetical protein DDZ74_19685 [Pseudomonas sp.]|nr:hypothetical protein [Pseudomonas sp.]
MTTLLAFYQNIGPALSLLVVLTFLLAGAVKGVIGLGLPTIAMGLLGLAMPPAQAAALLIVPSTLTNLWQLASGGHLRGLLVRLGPMLALILVGTLLGSAWLGINTGPWAAHALGGALLVYALYGVVGPGLQVAPGHERWLGPLCGLVTGVVTASTGVFVMPAVPYLQSLGLSREQMIQALGLSAADELDNNNGYGYFAALDALIVTEPTRTNVNDFRAILILETAQHDA